MVEENAVLRKLLVAGAVIALISLSLAQAKQAAVGKPVTEHHMVIRAVYLQSVSTSGATPGEINGPGHFDVHVEAHIRAGKNEPHGFRPGAWMPYLSVTYLIGKKGSDWHDFGTLRPMVASNGPHYGSNVKLDGPGKYTLTLKIAPPAAAALPRHTSRQTRVPPWWKPFKVSWTFVWAGNGKLGGY